MPYVEDVSVLGASGSYVQCVDNAVKVNSRSAFDQAVLDGRAFSWASLTYDPDANDTILGVENNSLTHLLKITRLIFTSDTASQIKIFASSGVTMAGTAVTGVNLNRNTNRVAEATADCDETGNGAQGSSYPGLIMQYQVAANTEVDISFGDGIALPYDHMIGVDLTTAATAANGTFFGYFDPI